MFETGKGLEIFGSSCGGFVEETLGKELQELGEIRFTELWLAMGSCPLFKIYEASFSSLERSEILGFGS